ncbi:MAG: type II toxin-antitoxin system HicB family antitoxin [Candidatus Paceibacterota bacterium]|jgi:predicted RNase H-like HicB family nuclease
MLKAFFNSKLKRAEYKILEDGSYFGEIKDLKGVWAQAKDLEACREELLSVLEDWTLVKIKFGEKIPGFSFGFDKRKEFSHA